MASKRTRQGGQTALLLTFGLTAVFGVIGLVTDVGYCYYRKQNAQAAAQAAALAAVKAAFASSAGNFVCGSNNVVCDSTQTNCPSTITGYGSDNIQVGCLYAKTNGYTTAGKQKVAFESGTGSIDGVYVTYWATAWVSEQLPLLFSAVTGTTQATLTARATAGYIPATAGGCIYVIAPTGASMTMNGNTFLDTGCGVWDDSSASNAVNLSGGNTTITVTGSGQKVQIVGGYSCYGGTTGCISPTPTTGAPNSGDPLAGLPAPTDPGVCTTPPSLNGHSSYTQTNPTGTIEYCSNVNVPNNSTLTLSAGTYIFKGSSNCGLSVAGQATLQGTGVFLYFEGGCAPSFSGGATITGASGTGPMTAPTSGTYNGVLMFEDHSDSATASLTGGSSQLMNGILYFPGNGTTGPTLHYAGGSSSGTNSQSASIVAWNLTIDGNSYIQNAGSSPYIGTFSGFAVIE